MTGKLLRHIGEERIVRGADSIWYGSPQHQIQAFRAFTVSEAFQALYGFPALTAQAKRRRRAACREEPIPSFATFGPKNRREFLALWDACGGRPG